MGNLANMNTSRMIVMTDAVLITAVVQRGAADTVVQAAYSAGAPGATVFYARGTGVRQKRMGLLGLAVNVEKEVIYMIVPSDQADLVFERIFVSAKLDTPGMGILWMSPISQMATHVPHEIVARFGIHREGKTP